ncbi:MAG: ABC transporter permease [Armatimonadetes bacterium]|nr:ABC transporter permease [Armatimonadota bacterium]
MNLGDSFHSAVLSIVRNKLRSSLTMLGVVIGVGSVITMIGIGEGTKQKSLENIQVMGSNMITIMPDWRRNGQSGGSANATLKTEDVDTIKAQVPTVELISGAVNGGVTAKLGNRSAQTRVQGCEPQMAIIRNATKMLQGQWFNSADNDMMERKAVLGWQVYDNLFAGDNAIGTTIKVKGQNYEVVGVVAYKGGTGMMNPDDQIYVPLKTAQKRLFGKDTLDFISVQAMDTDLMPTTQGQIEDALYAKRKTASGDALFRVFNQGEQLEQIQQQSKLLSYLLAGIASVSLLVGGIGIMNIMLVSVTERTKEIGLRKAIGAKAEGILTQFLLESIVMCVLGGALGVLFGWVAIYVVSPLLQVPPIVNIQAVIVAFTFSLMVGVFFGLYPAIRASRLQPIEALRYE